MERRKFNLAAWAAAGVAIILTTISGLQSYSVTKYKADLFENQAKGHQAELTEFKKAYLSDRDKTNGDISDIKQSVARIEEKLGIPQRGR